MIIICEIFENMRQNQEILIKFHEFPFKLTKCFIFCSAKNIDFELGEYYTLAQAQDKWHDKAPDYYSVEDVAEKTKSNF